MGNARGGVLVVVTGISGLYRDGGLIFREDARVGLGCTDKISGTIGPDSSGVKIFVVTLGPASSDIIGGTLGILSISLRSNGPVLLRVRVGPFFVTIGVGVALGGGDDKLVIGGREGAITYVGAIGSTVSTNLNECLVVVSLVTGLYTLAPPL